MPPDGVEGAALSNLFENRKRKKKSSFDNR